MRVLIADDDPLAELHVRSVVAPLGHSIESAGSGVEAWEKYLAFRPHVVVSDWLMPELSGLDLCRRIRQTENKEETYVIIITALSESSHRIEALGAGASELMVKPIDSDELLLRLSIAERLVLGENAREETTLRSALATQSSNDIDWIRALVESYATRGEYVKARAFLRRYIAAMSGVLGPEHERVERLRHTLEEMRP